MRVQYGLTESRVIQRSMKNIIVNKVITIRMKSVIEGFSKWLIEMKTARYHLISLGV